MAKKQIKKVQEIKVKAEIISPALKQEEKAAEPVKEEAKEELSIACENGKIAKKDISLTYRAGSCVPNKLIAKWEEMGIDYKVWF